jgi:hypothetical protein
VLVCCCFTVTTVLQEAQMDICKISQENGSSHKNIFWYLNYRPDIITHCRFYLIHFLAHPPSQMVCGDYLPGLKRPDLKANHSQSKVEIEKLRPPYPYGLTHLSRGTWSQERPYHFDLCFHGIVLAAILTLSSL